MSARDIAVRFIGDATGLTRAADDASQATSRFSDRTRKLGRAAQVGALAVGGALVAGMKAGVEGIREGEEAEARFTDQLSRAPAAIRATSDALKANAEAAQAHTRFSYEDTLAVSGFLAAQDGLQAAVKSGTTTIEDATNVTLDLATAMGTDGTSAAKALGAMLNAPEKAAARLRKAGVALTEGEEAKLKAWVKSGDTAKAQGLIMDKLKKKTEGAAKASGETTEGQMIRAQAAFGEVQESLAAGLIPVLTKFMGWGVKITKWAQDNPGKMKAIVVVLGSLAAIVGAVTVAMRIWGAVTRVTAAAQAVLNAVMKANPAIRITLLLMALGAAIVVLWKRSETFRRIVTAAFDAVKRAASAVVSGAKAAFSTLFAILTAPYRLAWTAIQAAFSKIRGAATTAKDWVVSKFDALVSFVTGLPGKIRSAASGMWDGIKDAFRGAVNFIIGGWNRLEFKVPGFKVGPVGYDGFTLGLPDIPMLAKGGTAYGGQAHLVGEAGPELFVPGRTGTVIPNHALGGAETINLTLDLGEGIRQVVEIQLDRSNRATVAKVRQRRAAAWA